jgi:hypothetical protein
MGNDSAGIYRRRLFALSWVYKASQEHLTGIFIFYRIYFPGIEAIFYTAGIFVFSYSGLFNYISSPGELPVLQTKQSLQLSTSCTLTRQA